MFELEATCDYEATRRTFSTLARSVFLFLAPPPAALLEAGGGGGGGAALAAIVWLRFLVSDETSFCFLVLSRRRVRPNPIQSCARRSPG